MEDIGKVVDELDTLLENERAALLAGKLEEVGDMLPRKEELIDYLAALEIYEREQLEELNMKVEYNQALLDQALEGIRTVARRLAALRRVRTALDTYNERGVRQTIEVKQDTSVEKRA